MATVANVNSENRSAQNGELSSAASEEAKQRAEKIISRY